MAPKTRRQAATRRNAQNVSRKSADRSHAKSKIFQTALSFHPLSSYPSSPSEYFRAQCKEISDSADWSTKLPLIFSDLIKKDVLYLPKELVVICIGYYSPESIESMIKWTLKSMQAIVTNDYRSRLDRMIAQAPSSIQHPLTRSFQRIFAKMVCRRDDYIWWFQVRELVPCCISIDDLHPPLSICKPHMVARGAEAMVQMDFNEKVKLPVYKFYGFQEDIRAFPEVYEGRNIVLDQAIRYHQCLNPINVSDDRIRECARGIASASAPASAKANARWEEILRRWFIAFAAIQVWIGDIGNFSKWRSPSEAQQICKIEWNAFNSIYNVGTAFSV